MIARFFVEIECVSFFCVYNVVVDEIDGFDIMNDRRCVFFLDMLQRWLVKCYEVEALSV